VKPKLKRLKKLEATLPLYAARRMREREGQRRWLRECGIDQLRGNAIDHAFRVLALSTHGAPRIDEPLESAWSRTLVKLNVIMKFGVFREPELGRAIRREMSGSLSQQEIKEKLAADLPQVPDWLRFYCFVDFTTRLLDMIIPIDVEATTKWARGRDGLRVWPLLPTGTLMPRSVDEPQNRYSWLSVEECLRIVEVTSRPEDEWTRRETLFMREIFRREQLEAEKRSSSQSREESDAKPSGSKL
jgi:hypothetical protein